MAALAFTLAAALASDGRPRHNEFKRMRGGHREGGCTGPCPAEPHTYINLAELPQQFTWCDRDGKSYCTKSLNQHIPQYCGSCWAFGSMSALSDRVKIMRQGVGSDVMTSVQHLLNCGDAGSCLGGDHYWAYHWVHQNGHIATDTNMNYLACSSDSKEGFCPHIDTTCSALNVARTCFGLTAEGGGCVGLDHYPNVSVAHFGTVTGEQGMMAEIYERGPIACGVNADPLIEYEPTKEAIIRSDSAGDINHVVSIVGWGRSDEVGKYWIVRNQWGEYWGDMGYFKIKRGDNTLKIEEDCAWAVPSRVSSSNFPCHEDGANCNANNHVTTSGSDGSGKRRGGKGKHGHGHGKQQQQGQQGQQQQGQQQQGVLQAQ